MTDSIKDFEDADLLESFQINAMALSIARKKPEIYHTKFHDLMKDQMEIEKEITGRMPIDYMWEIEQIKTGVREIKTGIRPGNQYKHVGIGCLRIQVIDEHDYNGPLWSVRVFIYKVYACRFIVKTSTILEHFQRIVA